MTTEPSTPAMAASNEAEPDQLEVARAEGMDEPDGDRLVWPEAPQEANAHLELAVADAADGRVVPARAITLTWLTWPRVTGAVPHHPGVLVAPLAVPRRGQRQGPGRGGRSGSGGGSTRRASGVMTRATAGAMSARSRSSSRTGASPRAASPAPTPSPAAATPPTPTSDPWQGLIV